MLLISAAGDGDIEYMKKKLEDGADINKRNHSGGTALSVAAHNGHLKAVKFLLDEGADINAQNKDGYTVLMEIARNDNFYIGTFFN